MTVFWFDRARADVDGDSWETTSLAVEGIGETVVAALSDGWQLPDPAPEAGRINWSERRPQEIPAKQATPAKKRRKFFGRNK